MPVPYNIPLPMNGIILFFFERRREGRLIFTLPTFAENEVLLFLNDCSATPKSVNDPVLREDLGAASFTINSPFQRRAYQFIVTSATNFYAESYLTSF